MIPNDNKGVFVPIVNITYKYSEPIIILKSIFLSFASIRIIIGVSIDIIPLISLAELKKPNVPALVISYVLNPKFRQFGTRIHTKYVINITKN